MPDHEPASSESQRLEQLAKQLADLEWQTAELQAAIRRSAGVRRMLVLLVVVLLGVFGWLYYTTGKSLTTPENLNTLKARLQERANENAAAIMHQVQLLAERTWPTVSLALSEQFKKDMPAIMTQLGAERDNLALNLRDRLNDHIRAQYAQSLTQHRGILQEEFPDVKDDEAFGLMIHNFQTALDPLVKAYYGDRLQEQFELMYKRWDRFPQDDSRRTKEELADELYLLLFQLMQTKLAGVTGEASPVAAPRAGGAG